MYFVFDTPNPAIDGRFRHWQVLLTEPLLDFDHRTVFYPQIKYSPFLFGEIAFPAEPLAFRLGKFGLDVQGVSPLFDSSPLGLPLFLPVYCNLRH